MNKQLALDLAHRPAHGAEDFLVAPCNAEAIAWLDRWPDWPGPALALHGPAGCGKTHMAHVWKARSGALLLKPDEVAATAPDVLLTRSNRLIIDDASAGQDEHALLHLYNMTREAQGHLLITSRVAPARWAIELPDLRSRLSAAPAVAIGRPDDGLIGAVLVKLFADRQLPVESDVLTFILPRMERTFSAARALVAALDRSSLAARRRITIPLARDVMAELEEQNLGD
ncbi:MAG: DNA replication protein [Alphaproteobacteria bacterium]|nr:DNA replication protein [Alphaproteobacteria bacterium]